MSKINLESQLKSLYNKAGINKNKISSEVGVKKPGNFDSTLKVTIERVNDIASTADNALKGLKTNNNEEAIKEEINQAGSLNKRIMKAQSELTTLYRKLQTSKEQNNS